MKNINLKKLSKIFKKGNISLKKCIASFALASTLLFTGCGSSNDKGSKIEEMGISITSLEDTVDTNIYRLNNINVSSFNKLGFDNFENECDEICTPNEFGKYTGESNITYDDIRNTLDNSSIEDKYKSIIRDGVDKLEKNNFNMKLEVLNYNLKNLKIKKVSSDENLINNSEGISTAATFNPYNHTVSINNEKMKNFNNVFLHEILGHGMTSAYIDDKKVLCGIELYYSYVEDDTIIDINSLGLSFCESVAELIRHYATDTIINYDDTAYTSFAYTFLVLCKSNGIKVEEYANNGILYLFNKMKENKIDNYTFTILAIDSKYKSIIFGDSDIEYSFNEILCGYFDSFIEKDINERNDLGYATLRAESIIDCGKGVLKPLKADDNRNYYLVCNANCGDYICIEELKDYVKGYNSEYVDSKVLTIK